jgi:uncharacterized protein (DUF1800 family)
MPDQVNAAAAIALNRFGLGARPGEAPPADPAGWLRDQLEAYEPLPPPIAKLGDPPARLAATIETLRQLRDAREQRETDQQRRRELLSRPREDYRISVKARAEAAVQSSTPFVERLVHFWSNHFAVSKDRASAAPFIPIFETAAIRPHVLGRFEDMLLAVERHPAMLLYLDQAQSVGPNSTLAQFAERRQPRRTPGLNENLAREILELHTLGARSGYTQQDVTEFARAMTGWTVDLPMGRMANLQRRFGHGRVTEASQPSAGAFVFRPAIHEPGSRTILGREYKQQGEAQARAILHDVANAPATARHIAAKLAAHFAGDDPPPALVGRLAAAFEKSNGHLPTLYRVLIDSPEAWAPAPTKFKSPWEWAISALRGCGIDGVDHPLPGNLQPAPLLEHLGQPVWRPGSPAGWSDNASAWAAPDALLRRVEAAPRFGAHASRQETMDPNALARDLLPGSLGDATKAAIAGADSRATAIALLLVSPEFQRR